MKYILWISRTLLPNYALGIIILVWEYRLQLHLAKYAFHPWRRYSRAAWLGFLALMMPRPTMIMSLPLSQTTWKKPFGYQEAISSNERRVCNYEALISEYNLCNTKEHKTISNPLKWKKNLDMVKCHDLTICSFEYRL